MIETAKKKVIHLHRKTSYFSICQSLRYCSQSNCEACQQIHL